MGAFGEVALVRKIDTNNHLYAMKTLRKTDVHKRNQVNLILHISQKLIFFLTYLFTYLLFRLGGSRQSRTRHFG